MATRRFTDIVACRHPIVSAPMGAVSGGRLAAAVSAAGGFGLIGGGYGRDRAWLMRELDLAGDMAKVGVGFITWSAAGHPENFDLVVERRPKAIMLSFGDPAPFAAKARRAGSAVICQVQSVEMAREAVAKGADVIVAQGTEAGGHGAACASLPLVPAVVDAVGDKVPVLAAGGIADGRGLAAAWALGADGALLGTRFYAADEALVHPAAKQKVVTGDGADTARGAAVDVIRGYRWPAPFTIRTQLNDFVRRWNGREADLAKELATESARYAAAAEAGDFDHAAVIVGEAAGLVHDVVSAGEIVRRIAEEARQVVARLASR
ncbi:NAD(P)H-dependent flavin oxidoreductase [Bradyrhizobium sp. 2TAF24]|uniref:NAD(P)H-dependent flavin oxidoreductase n=1 Tax=Bradyrhizobium sp. 2TAF24 TaxID=3233011 RepID=UPI003F932DF2